MPLVKYRMLRSARRARLEARITPVQPMRRSFLDSFTTSEEVTLSRRHAAAPRGGATVSKGLCGSSL